MSHDKELSMSTKRPFNIRMRRQKDVKQGIYTYINFCLIFKDISISDLNEDENRRFQKLLQKVDRICEVGFLLMIPGHFFCILKNIFYERFPPMKSMNL